MTAAFEREKRLHLVVAPIDIEVWSDKVAAVVAAAGTESAAIAEAPVGTAAILVALVEALVAAVVLAAFAAALLLVAEDLHRFCRRHHLFHLQECVIPPMVQF